MDRASSQVSFTKHRLHCTSSTINKNLHRNHKTDFKHRFNKNTKYFNLEQYENDTELPKEYWMTKHNPFTPNVTCKIITKCAPININKRKRYLRLIENLEIASFKADNYLNKISELIDKCRH